MFVNRDDTLQEIEADMSSSHRCPFVFVTGAPGPGKITVLDQFSHRRRRHGRVVIVVAFFVGAMSIDRQDSVTTPRTEFLVRFVYS